MKRRLGTPRERGTENHGSLSSREHGGVKDSRVAAGASVRAADGARFLSFSQRLKKRGDAPMKNVILAIVVLSVAAFALLAAPGAQAQVTREHLDAVGANLHAAQSFYNKLSPQQRKMFSGAALNFFHVVKEWPELEGRALAIQKLLGHGQLAGSSGSSGLSQTDVPTTAVPVRVSNPQTDFEFGPSGAFTQSETSTAWCGTNVVVGFNDSGSFWESGFATGFSNLSFNGFALSTTQGTANYTDEGFLPSAGTGNPFNFLVGDPVLACTSASNFYYASLLETVTSTFQPLTAISVSKSTNGGASFGPPTIAVEKNGFFHFLDKPWMAISPAHTSQIAVTYTDFDFSGTVCGFTDGFANPRIAIELVGSSNGGSTWSAPTVIDEVCETPANFFLPFVQGSQVAFSPSGAVNVAFEFYPFSLSPPRAIMFTQAPSLGGTFGGLVTVATVNGVGDSFELQGGFRAFLDLQGMAVDSSGKSTNGNIYIVWHDTDFVDSAQVFNGVPYFYSDVWISRSTNNGRAWSTPVQVNTNTEPPHVDSYIPGVAVDNTSGDVAVCWYDRRNDPLNYKFDRFCGDSFDAGASFTNFQITPAASAPIHATDDLINPFYMGDYDTVASDTLKTTSGFIGAFQITKGEGDRTPVPNPDVVAQNFN
jgi:hypothetical protein